MVCRLLDVSALDRCFMLPVIQQLRDVGIAGPKAGRPLHRSNGEVGFAAFVRDLSEQHERVIELRIDLEGALQRLERRRRSARVRTLPIPARSAKRHRAASGGARPRRARRRARRRAHRAPPTLAAPRFHAVTYGSDAPQQRVPRRSTTAARTRTPLLPGATAISSGRASPVPLTMARSTLIHGTTACR